MSFRTPSSNSNSNVSVNSRATGSATARRRKGWSQGLALFLMAKGANGPEEWSVSNRKKLKNYVDVRTNVTKALGLAGIARNAIHPIILKYLNRKASFINTFGKTPAKTKPRVKSENGSSPPKGKFKREEGVPSPRSNELAEWVKRQTVINMNKYLAVEKRIMNTQERLERAQESRVRDNIEAARSQVRELRKNFREQQRNLREAVMRRDSTFARSSYGSGLRATPFYTRYMQRIYQRADGHYVLLGRNGRPGRAMPYPDFAYRNTGRGIVPQYAQTRRRQKKTLFSL